MDAKIIQKFKGSINGIEITDREIYIECEYILDEIEDVLDIELPTSFIKDFIQIYEYVFYNVEPQYAHELKSDIISSWDQEITNIKDLEFNLEEYNDPCHYFAELNKKIKDWDNTYCKYPNDLNLKK